MVFLQGLNHTVDQGNNFDVSTGSARKTMETAQTVLSPRRDCKTGESETIQTDTERF